MSILVEAHKSAVVMDHAVTTHHLAHESTPAQLACLSAAPTACALSMSLPALMIQLAAQPMPTPDARMVLVSLMLLNVLLSRYLPMDAQLTHQSSAGMVLVKATCSTAL